MQTRSRTKHWNKLKLSVLGIFCLTAAGIGVWSELLADTTTSNFRGKQIHAHFEITGTSADVNGYENFVHGKNGSQTAWVSVSGNHWTCCSSTDSILQISAGGSVDTSAIAVNPRTSGSVAAEVPGSSTGWDGATGTWDWGTARTVGVDVALTNSGDVGLEIGGSYFHIPGTAHSRQRYNSQSALETTGTGHITVNGADFIPAGTATSWGELRDVKSGTLSSWN